MEIHSNAVNQRVAGRGLPFGASLFTAFICMLFGANAVAVKISLTGLGVFTTAGLRFCVASVVIFLWALYAGKPLAVSKAQFRQLALLGVIFFSQLAFFYVGQNKTTASHGTLITNVLPFVVMVLAHFFIPGETITLKKIFGLILGFTGVLILFLDSVLLTADALKGDVIILAAVLIWGCNAVYTKRIIHSFHPIQIILYPMLMASMMFVLFGFLFDETMVRFIDGRILAALFYQMFVTASFGMLAWVTMIKKYGATALHSFVFLMPISGVFLGVVLLDEPLTATLMGAILLVVTGLIVVNRVTIGDK